MAETNLLEVQGATKLYGGVAAVSDISFNVKAGEILGLIGPNGAGKTTLVNLISGTIVPTSGNIRFKETILNGKKPHVIGKMGIARTFQVVQPFQNLTVLENVAVGAMYGRSGTKRSTAQAFKRAEEVLELVHLENRRHELAEHLNIVGRKRLELAKALAMDPELLLLDEVMAGLRGTEIDEAMNLIRSIHASGITLLVIEHVIKVIVGVCQRVVVLDYGKKIAEGTPDQITSDPAVIQAYLGKRYTQRQAQRQSLAE